jgi:preprotein translocase subunit SecF
MNYKQVMIFPIIILLLSVIYLVFELTTTGLKVDIDFKGGSQIIADFQTPVSGAEIEAALKAYDANVRTATSLTGSSIIIGVDTSVNPQDVINTLEKNGFALKSYSTQTVGSALGESFFQQAVIVLIFAFVCMAITVFIIFRIPLPSGYVVLCGFANITDTLVVSQILGINMSLATFTSLLLLLGYGVDTDILLTTRVFKTTEGQPEAKIRGAIKTGLTMSGATIAALAALFVISTSTIIVQIASVLLIGLLFDMLNTWLLNAPLLRMYIERKAK